MAENAESKMERDRSPAYPIIPLEAAIARLTAFEAHFKRSPARPHKVGDAWGIKAKAYADRTRAALRYFGLIEYQGAGKDRQVIISDDGRRYLRAQQEETKREVLTAAALRPKQIAKFWREWGEDRPEDAACLNDLVFKNDFSEEGARKFLKVYDATITFAGLSDSDKNSDDYAGHGEDEPVGDGSHNTIVPAAKGPAGIPKRNQALGMVEATLPLDEGQAILQWPDKLSQDSYQDFEDWVGLMLRRAKRSIVGSDTGEEPTD